MVCSMRETGFRHLMIETGSLSSIHLIQHQFASFHPFAAMIASIKSLLSFHWEVHISHTLREANACVDVLAKKGPSS
ncbi:hypothetical protein glysoja_029659 [Glycine soja]|uniref:RNase H type-1 domain-containing protein n=1 Tax=Glycine soja TaxID=3848 RepID=A0A0B2RGR5_GLYSO|nr:hypothetical protein glysoja_029659 [Glycine soja]